MLEKELKINMDVDEEMRAYISEISRELNNMTTNADKISKTIKSTTNKKKSHNRKTNTADTEGWKMLFYEVLACIAIAGGQVYFIKRMLTDKLLI